MYGGPWESAVPFNQVGLCVVLQSSLSPFLYKNPAEETWGQTLLPFTSSFVCLSIFYFFTRVDSEK